MFKIKTLERTLRVKDGQDVQRIHNMIYRRNPKKTDIAGMSKDNLFRHVLEEKPNIILYSSRHIYSSDKLVASLGELGYVDTAGYKGVFSPYMIDAAARGKENSRLTSTGTVLKLVE